MFSFCLLVQLNLVSQQSGLIVLLAVAPSQVTKLLLSLFLLRSHYIVILLLVLLYVVKANQFLFLESHFELLFLSLFLDLYCLVLGIQFFVESFLLL